MTQPTGEERALARAAVYRLLALAFSYPTPEVRDGLPDATRFAEVAAELVDPATARAVEGLQAAFGAGDLEAWHQRVFTLSYSEDCPPYETAFSARHIFQQTQHQADLTGFYRAFGVDPSAERPDHLAVELEFGYLLAVKEAHARAAGERDHVAVCRSAHRAFLRDHLARWAPLLAQRIVVTAPGSPYAAAARLLLAFVAWEERYLRLGRVERFRDEPILIADEPGDMTCPVADGAVASMVELAGVGKGGGGAR